MKKASKIIATILYIIFHIVLICIITISTFNSFQWVVIMLLTLIYWNIIMNGKEKNNEE